MVKNSGSFDRKRDINLGFLSIYHIIQESILFLFGHPLSLLSSYPGGQLPLPIAKAIPLDLLISSILLIISTSIPPAILPQFPWEGFLGVGCSNACVESFDSILNRLVFVDSNEIHEF